MNFTYLGLSKPGPKPRFKPVEMLFLVLVWLRLGLTLNFTAWLFNIPKSNVFRYIITCLNFMHFKLVSVPVKAEANNRTNY